MIGIPTCTLASGVTIGWANVARYADFCAIIEQRMARGYVYRIVGGVMRREVVYNAAVKINTGSNERELGILALELPRFIERGDISIVAISHPVVVLHDVVSAREVLENDTIELKQQ